MGPTAQQPEWPAVKSVLRGDLVPGPVDTFAEERPELRKGTGILKVAKKLGVGHSTVARVKARLHHA